MMDPFSVPMVTAVLCAFVGLVLGNKFRHHSPDAPVLTAMGLGLLGFVFSTSVIAAAGIGALLFAVYGLFKARRYFQTALETFAAHGGQAVRGVIDWRPHRTKMKKINQQHRERMRVLRSCDYDHETLQALKQAERERFRQELLELHRGEEDEGFVDVM